MAESFASAGSRRSRSDDARIRVKAALAVGRYTDALVSIRRARRSPDFVADPFLALEEAEALFGLLRAGDALVVATAALRRNARLPRDLEARLRVCRALGLWRTGKPDQAGAEADRAAALCTTPLTRARVHELRVSASQAEGRERAKEHATAAAALYGRGGSPEGVARALGQEARLLSDEGLIGQALEVQTRRLETVSRTTRLDALAVARSERGGVLTILGRWDEARLEIERAAELFRQLSDPREVMVAGVSRASLDLAVGRLEAAGLGLARAREAGTADRTDQWARGEALLISSDQALAANDPAAAENLAAEGLRLFTTLKDPRGECRGRVRRCHALLGQGRVESAVREARQALGLARPIGAGVEALVQLALGRALLRTDRNEAALAFDRVLRLPGGRSDLSHAARLGSSLSRAANRLDDTAALRALEAWGDHRLLTHCLADMQELGVGLPAPATAPERVAGSPPAAPSCRAAASAVPDAVVALLDAASALSGADGAESARDRFAAAVQALRRVLPWRRAVIVGEPGWELRGDATIPLPLAAAEIARAMTAGAEGPLAIEVASDSRFANHPARLLHGIETALLAPLASGRWMYVDFAEEAPGPHGLGLLVQFARLLDQHLEAPSCPEAPGRRFPEIVGRCPAMLALFQAMEQVAAADTSVHIFGETGTGKERIARALHEHSPRSRAPFVPVNASSLSDEMFESEVFGHARGAFTGAVGERKGYVAEAEGGTLFIDEVTDLSPRAQAKLLRFLQEREYRRVGESNLRRANVRILTASNVSFDERVAGGHFRSDLLYRLNTVTLRLPPLRERGGDIRVLAQHFLREKARQRSRPVPALPAAVSALLEKYSWPGNVRELANTMERLLTFAGEGALRPELLSELVDKPQARSAGTLREAQWAFERNFVSRALAGHGGNKARTAAAIGISRQALLQKIQRLGL